MKSAPPHLGGFSAGGIILGAKGAALGPWKEPIPLPPKEPTTWLGIEPPPFMLGVEPAMVVPDPKEPVPVLDPKAPTLDPLKDPKEPLKVEPTDPLEDDPTVGPKGFVNPHDKVDEEVNPGVGTIVGIGPVFAMVEEMMAVVVAGLVAAAVLDSVDISSKGV